MSRLPSAWWIPCVLGALAVACSSPRPNVGGETHWLLACNGPDDCGNEGLSCICGVCTRVCSEDGACAGSVDAACFDLSSPLLVRRCGGSEAETSAGVCLAECTLASECDAPQVCVDGACVPSTSDAPDAGSSAPSREEIDSFLDASTGLNWSTPIAAPVLRPTIAGADARLTGTWVERDCDPAEPAQLPPFGCVRLTIEQDRLGAVTGRLQVDRTAQAARRLGETPPFAGEVALVDPDIGYPPGMSPSSYWELTWKFPAGIPYRILDGHFEDGRFTFSWSKTDLWHDWCVQQTSHRWMIGDHAFAFCAPQDREQWGTLDEGMLVLCTSADFEPLCAGGLTPCVCVGGDDPRCSHAYCRCDEAGCDADVLLWRFRVELSVDGDVMTGRWLGATAIGHDNWSGTLQRATR
jgi:hypothetical protein